MSGSIDSRIDSNRTNDWSGIGVRHLPPGLDAEAMLRVYRVRCGGARGVSPQAA